MLCHICEPFLNDLVNEDLVTWRHVEPGWYTYKHSDHATVKAAAEAGCEVCTLFTNVRTKRIRGYEELNEKWLAHASSIDYKSEHDRRLARASGTEQQTESRAKWTFYLLTVLPEMSWIAFELFNPVLPPDSNREVAVSTTLPYDVSPVASHGRAMASASFWLSECLTSHSHCSRQARTPLPTRVLDIRPSGDSFELRLQVNKGHQGQYVTLSHCWGSKGRLKLVKSNLAAFQQSVPFEELPQTFADAIRLTAALGQRYLWIDALCILQDDQQDWRREAATMCSVFENALFSISALAAEDSHSGLLQERQNAQVVANVAESNVGIRERLPSLDEALQFSTLETRAWCLQERLLSPRILHVARGQLYWECRTYILSETSPHDSLENDSGESSRPFTATTFKPAASKKQDDDHHVHWLVLVAGYSGRNLTKPSDRLPAISGLAEKAKKELGLGTYMHGMWLDNLHAGLLWRRKIQRRHVSSDADTLPLGPTWSWASSIGLIEYPLLDDDFERRPTKADMIVKKRDPTDTREVGGHGTSSLSIIGLIKRGSCKERAAPSKPNEAVFRASGSLLVDEGVPCTLDEVDEPLSRGCYCLFIGIFEKATKSSRKESREQRSCYLILERIQTGDAPQQLSNDLFGRFRRIGMGFDPSQKVDKIFANAERRRLELT